MRYLNKIVFLNSAHIPLAEIMLHGNVHFAGTQGVGKSTIQRAILFFYNADQMKLGISREKKSFAEYYFEHPNSYIVYEVMRDKNPYMVVAFINRGRINFRFVNAPYKREFFIDGNHEVYSNWEHIRKQLGGATVSPIVDRLEEYRNIIYGNKNETRPQFRGYSITESSKYQNIPRTIQNVFLNSKLEAEVIKKTIIDSMADMELSIDIDSLRSLISEFGQEYRDIMKWEERNAKGVVVVRRQADNVISQFNDILFVDSQIQELCGKIRFAQQRDSEAKPLHEERRGKLIAEQDRIQRLIREEKQKYDDEQSKMLRQIGALDDKLKRAAQKRKKYAEMGIDDIIRLVESEAMVKEEINRQEDVRNALTRQYESIASKYEILIAQAEQSLRQFTVSQDARKNAHKESLMKVHEKIYAETDRKCKAIASRFEEKERETDELIAEQNRELAELTANLVRIKQERKYGAEIDAAEAEIRRKEEERRQNESATQLLNEKKTSLLKQWEIIEADFDKQLSDEREKTKAEKERIEGEIGAEEAILSRQEGSLYSWLEANKEGWERNIGKVTDERILYHTALNPKKSANGDSLFGIEINLEAVERNIRTPEEIRKAIENLKTQLQKHKDQSAKRIREIDANKEARRAVFSKEIGNIKKAINELAAKLAQCPSLLKKAKAELIGWQQKDQEFRDRRKNDNATRTQEANHRLQTLKQERDNIREQKANDISNAEKERQKLLKNEQEKCDTACRDIDEETATRQRETDTEIHRYRQECNDELAGQGADTARLKELDDKTEKLRQTLKDIESKRETYYNYKKDKEELLDREPDLRNDKRQAEEKKASLDERYRQTAERHQRQKSDKEQQLAEVKAQIALIDEGTVELDNLILTNPHCPQTLKEASAAPINTNDPCKQLVDQLKATIYGKRDKQDKFKNAINLFKSNFSAKNTFNFKTELNDDDSYTAFAENLKEFIDNDMVETYRQRLSDHYADILKRISKETGDVMRYGSDIERTINDINRDFDESNFAGVIKKISLKKVESNNQLMQLLVTIKHFCDENAHNMGELNIFSDEKERTEVGRKTVELLFSLQKAIEGNPTKSRITLDDTFRLQFRIQENDNDTGWIERISNVGSDGTDVLVKAMVNIMLINVFKKKMSRHFDDYQLHCMMDEIGKLHPSNVKGILAFANRRNIFLINSSPISYTANDYSHNYLLEKDAQSNTRVKLLMSRNSNFNR